MSDIIIQKSSSNALAVPAPKEELTTRLATNDDIPWIDELQKKYNKNLGFMPKLWLENKIKAGQILVAEEKYEVRSMKDENADAFHQGLRPKPQPLGYIIAQDRYLKRDELGIVYQLVVSTNKQRSFIGAALLKAQFDRSEYGCRLYCCWCAQDLEANHFWEAMGFYPLAYRNGAEKKGKDGKPRVQIFWQKKIRGKDDAINWWFPAKTEAGAMGADRLVLPIQPGVHWSEVEPIEIPTIGPSSSEGKLLEGDCPQSPTASKRGGRPSSKKIEQPKPQMLFGPPGMVIEPPKKEEVAVEKRAKKPKAPKLKQKIDPVFISKSKELRDKYLEQVNEHGYKLESAGKYELVRGIEEKKPICKKLLAA